MQGMCCVVIHIEPAFNWATEYQAASRVYRIGQTEPVEIIRLFTEGTYQELHEFFMLQKANTMFAAFEALQQASELVPGRETMTASEIALGAFGMYRGRVKDMVNLQSSKDAAKIKGKGKEPAHQA